MFEYSNELAQILLKAISDVEIKQTEEQTIYKMVISKEVEDRDGEIVKLDGMDSKNYMKNPVVLIDHNYRVESIVGKTIKLYQEGKNLIAEFIFAEGTEYGDLAKKLYDGGFLKTSSIGFMIYERDANNRDLITKWQLLEWSLVAVPCNPDALSQDGKMIYEEALAKGFLKSETQEDKPKEDIPEITKEDIEEIKSDISEIKAFIKNLADNKAQDIKQDELLEKKKTLQAIDNAVGEALKNFKLLK